MTLPLSCPNGHPLGSDAPSRCPACGVAVGGTTAGETTSLPGVGRDATEGLGPVAPPPWPGAGPPGYEIVRKLGEGGMGVVFLARQAGFGRLVALKMLRAGGQATERDRRRFRTEAEAIGRLTHPGIVQVHEVGEHDGEPFFSMEFCPGGSLRDRLHDHPLSPPDAAGIVRALAEAIAVAHKAGVLHRDLKPANVLLTEAGGAKIADFGLARKLDDAGQTAPGAILGTPSYMAPEQARGDADLTAAVDVYALGAVLYECLTGRPPFRAATAWETVGQVMSGEVVSPRQLNGKVPRDLETVCLRALHKEPARRYASAQDLADDLGRFLAGEPIHARPVGVLERAAKWVRRNPAVAALSAAVVVLLVAGTAVAATLAVLAGQRADALAGANADLEAKGAELTRTNDALFAALIEGWYGPIGQTRPTFLGGPHPLTASEVSAVREMAKYRQPGYAARLVRTGLADPSRTERMLTRAEYLLHAGVGLDEDERAAVEAVLLAELDRTGRPDAQRDRIARALARLGGLSDPARYAALARLLGEQVRGPDPFVLRDLRATLQGLLVRVTAEQARAQVAILLPALAPNDPGHRVFQGEALLLLAGRLPPGEARPIYPAVVRALVAQCLEGERPLAGDVEPVVRQALPHLTEAEVAQAGSALTAGLTRWQEGRSRLDLRAYVELVRAVAPRIAPADRDALATVLLAKVVAAREVTVQNNLTLLFGEVAREVSPAAARRLVEAVRDRLGPDAGRDPIGPRVNSLRALLERLDPADRRGLAATILPKLDALPVQASAFVTGSVFESFALLATALPEDEGQRRFADLARRLPAAAFLRTPSTRGPWPNLAACLAPDEAAHLTGRLLTDPATSGSTEMALEVLALLPRLTPAARRDLADAARKQVAAAPSAGAVVPPLVVAGACLETLDPADAAVHYDGLARDALRRWTALGDVRLTAVEVAECQRAVARWPRAERTWLVREMAAALHPARQQFGGRTYLFLSLVATVGPTLDPADAEAAADQLLANVLAGPAGLTTNQEMARFWEAFAPTLAPASNARLSARWLDQIEARPQDVPPYALEGLDALSRHAGAERRPVAERTIAFLREALRATTRPNLRFSLLTRLAAEVAALAEADARPHVEEVLSALHAEAATSTGYNRQALQLATLPLLSGVDPARRRAAVAALAARFAAAAGPGELPSGDDPVPPLEAVAPHLDAEQVAPLTRDLCRSGLNEARLARLLRALFGGVTRPNEACCVAGFVGGRLAETPWLGLAQVAPPVRLSDADLLALLAEPLCVGAPRRTVLEALELRHGRPFPDHWDAARFLRQRNRARP